MQAVAGTDTRAFVVADGSPVVSYLNPDGTQVRAVHALAEGGVENDTAVATTANGLDSASVVVDKDGQALVIWAECADIDCTTSRLQSSTRTDATTWSAPERDRAAADQPAYDEGDGEGADQREDGPGRRAGHLTRLSLGLPSLYVASSVGDQG